MKHLAILVALCAVLSGCFGGGKDKDDDEAPSDSASSSTGPAALGSIEVAVNRTTADGAAPLQVNFTLNATFRAANGTVVATPGQASWRVTVLAADANTTANATGSVVDGPSGTTLPANVTLALNATGNFTVAVAVGATGFASGNATFLVAVFAGSVGGGAPVFFDGGETDTSQWELSSNVLISNFNVIGEGPSEIELPQEHPDGPWEIVDSAARTGTHAWGHPYPDNYRTRMTSVPFTVPAGGATLSYWVKGGVEGTSVEGLFVRAGPADALVDLAHHSGVFADWTESTVDLSAFAGQEITLQFRIDSDLSCSNDGPPAGGDQGVCGEGFDGGGLLLDDIQVA